MSMEGNATADVVLRGTINNLDSLVIDAYDIAVKNGFDGTEEEWLASLHGKDGVDGEKGEKGDKGDTGDVADITYNKPTGTNLLDLDAIIANPEHGGMQDDTTPPWLTGYIPVQAGDVLSYQQAADDVSAIALTAGVVAYAYYYDANWESEGGVPISTATFTVPDIDGVAYVRLALTIAPVEPDNYACEQAIVRGAEVVDGAEFTSTPVIRPDYLPEIGGSVEGAVLYTEQTLTEEQKAQARENIGAGTGDGGTTDPYNDYQPDVPESMGVLNAILNAKQLAEIPIKPLASMPQKAGDWEAGKTKYGLPYSSSRVEEGFVPNFVSLETFMTALQNPNSYLYTVDLGEVYDNQNGTTYYGTVCSVFCAYALNIVPNYTTHQWQDIPGMEYVPCQSVYALKLGDTICHHTSGHVVMVTDITRNKRGKIGKITITEAATVKVKVTEYTPEELAAAYPTEDYAFHRYSKIHEVQHIQSPFVAVEDETPMEFTYNTALIPRKGDKANWLQGVPVEVDLLAKSGYNAVEVYKDDVLFKTQPISGGEVTPFDRTVYGLRWNFGSLNDDTITTTIYTTTAFPLSNVEITAQQGAKCQVWFDDSAGNYVGNTDFVSGSVVLNDIAPENAASVRLVAKYDDGRTVENVDSLAAMFSASVDDIATVMPLPFENGTLVSSSGGENSNGKRCRTGFIPLQNLRIEAESDVQYYIYYYDANKAYLSNNGAWLSGSKYVLDGAPSAAAYFRVVIKSVPEATIGGKPGVWSLKIPATIIGGTSEGGLDVLALEDLEYGNYKARLTDGTNHSDWCSWIVVDAVCSAVSSGVGSREATVTFSASNAEPLFVKWAGGHIKDGKPENGTKHITVLTEEQKAAGEAVCVYDMGDNNDWQYGEYNMRVAFQTEYGIIHTKLPDEPITV